MEGRRSRPPGAGGKDIFDIKPILLGGDPKDPANKVVLSRSEHIAAGAALEQGDP